MFVWFPLSQPCYRVCLFCCNFYLNCKCTRVSHKTNTSACRNSTVSLNLVIHQFDLSKTTIGITQLIGNDYNTYNGIFRYFDAPFNKNIYYQHVRNAVLAVCAKLVPVWGKRREMRGLLRGEKLSWHVLSLWKAYSLVSDMTFAVYSLPEEYLLEQMVKTQKI